MSKRSPATDEVQSAIVAQGATDPVGAAVAAQGLDGVKNNINGGDLAAGNTLIAGDSWSAANPQDNQFPWNYNVEFYPNAAATPGDAAADGWVALPQLGGFELNRAVIRGNATMPYYVNDYTASQIKKAVIVFPGKNRDSWKYTNLIRNAFNVALTNFPEYGLVNGSVLILGPAILNNFDILYGAAQGNDIAWHGSQWQDGGLSRWPSNVTEDRFTFYEILDYFADWLFNTTNFPNLNSVTVAGHSMGGQAVQRYALMKKQKYYDNNMHYLIGNPGSWAWITSTRAFQNSSCTDFDTWQYGLGGNTSKITKYARKDVIANKTEVVSRFRSRNVHYALALLDNGPGDTHCQAVMQGGNHLDRGSNFVQMLGAMPGGFPTAHTVDFIANVSHQDYAMLSTNRSLVHLFKDGYDQRLPDIVPHNPSDKNYTAGPNPNPPQRAFATTSHKMISYALLGGSIGAIVIIFTILPFLFPANSDPWEQERWEQDAKRQLMR
jgi:pimeloyl-ACP methyl ester carboxylesterase